MLFLASFHSSDISKSQANKIQVVGGRSEKKNPTGRLDDFRWRGDQVERQIPSGQEFRRGLRHHRRVEAGSPSGAGSLAEYIVDRGSHGYGGAYDRGADGGEEDRADPVEAKAPGDDIRAAASQRWLCASRFVHPLSPLSSSRSSLDTHALSREDSSRTPFSISSLSPFLLYVCMYTYIHV